jgi:endoribonuclease Dicer
MADRILLAKEMNATLFNETMNERDLLTALTPTSANVEHDYERLELLGASPQASLFMCLT